MKKYTFLLFISLLVLSCDSVKTGEEQDTIIYLKLIKELGPTDQIKKHLQISDNRGGAFSLPGFPEYYMSKVIAGKSVTWMNHPDSKEKIEVIEVNYIPNKISENILTSGHSRNNGGSVTEQVKKKGEVKNLSNHFYEVSFSINHKVFKVGSILQFHED